MSDSYSNPHQNGKNYDNSREGGRGNFRGGRGSGNRDAGGFRIRLSDNEMRASRSLQEAFNLRSTVAVLGFALRTLGQMLEDGKLDDLVAEQRSQASNRSGGRRDDSSRRSRNDNDRHSQNKGPKPNPFARPEKPQPTKAEETSIEQSPDEIQVSQNEKMEPENLDTSSNKELTSEETNEEKESNSSEES